MASLIDILNLTKDIMSNRGNDIEQFEISTYYSDLNIVVKIIEKEMTYKMFLFSNDTHNEMVSIINYNLDMFRL